MLAIAIGAPNDAAAGRRERDTDLLLWPLHYCFAYVSLEVMRPILLHDVMAAEGYGSPAESQAILSAAESALRSAVNALNDRPPVPFNRNDDFDKEGRLKPEVASFSPFVKHASA